MSFLDLNFDIKHVILLHSIFVNDILYFMEIFNKNIVI